MAKVTHKGNPIDIAGKFPTVGQTAPPFTLVGKDLSEVQLKDFAGKRKVLDIVVSLDTGICAASARKFNETAGKLPDTVVLVISGDLPFVVGSGAQAGTARETAPGAPDCRDPLPTSRHRIPRSTRRAISSGGSRMAFRPPACPPSGRRSTRTSAGT